MHGELRKRPLDWLLALKIISRDHRPEESKEREREERRTGGGMRMKFEWKFGKCDFQWRKYRSFFFLFFFGQRSILLRLIRMENDIVT